MHYVFKDSPAKRGARLVLLSLANHANDQYMSWPAVQTIQYECRMDERTVQRALRLLERDGEIFPSGRYSRGGRKATTYVLDRCRAWFENVGTPTAETPHDNRGHNAGFANENASTRSKYPPIPRRTATPPPAARRGYPGSTPPLPRQHAGVPPAERRGANAQFVTPAPAFDTEYPGATPPEPNEPSCNHQNLRTPLPPASGGNEKTVLYQCRDGNTVEIDLGNRRRLLSDGDAEGLVGMFLASDYVDFFRRRGFEARILPKGREAVNE